MTSARSMTSAQVAGQGAARWGMLAVISAGIVALTLAGLMSELSDSYAELAFFRVVSGIGGSVFIAVGTAAVVVWFRQQDVTLALGITGGAVFSAGAACALYAWLYVQRATSWHTSLILAGAFELVVMLVTMATFRVPDGELSLGGARFDRAVLGATLADRDLWFYGLALLGGYGAYFTTSQLFSEYVTLERHFDPSTGGLLSALIALAGIPGSVLGGYCADRSGNLRMFVVGPLFVVAALLVLIPVVPARALWALGIGIGFFLIFGFGFDVGWVFLAIVSFAFALLGLSGRNPATAN
jgi:MFS transporter, ACS family, D-galactonate transporter